MRYFSPTFCVIIALLSVFCLKLLLAYEVPLTADEAYYTIWGTYLSGGGYDHPPMIGFLLFPLLRFSHHILILRLPAVLSSLILGSILYLYLKKEDSRRAAIASMLLMLTPASLFNIFITTDTPLLIFSFLSVVCVLVAMKHNDDWRWFALGGVFLGLAFFSKYFAILLGISYAIYLLLVSPTRARFLGLSLLVLGALPFAVQNIYWNYHHDWSNLLFNIYNRNHDVGFRSKNIVGYLLTIGYLATPPLLFTFFSFPARVLTKQALFYFFSIPITFFLLLSSFKSIGLHWPLSFIPFIFMWAGENLSTVYLKKLRQWMTCWSGVQLMLIFSVLLAPINWMKKCPIQPFHYNKWVYFFHHAKVNKFLYNRYPKNCIYASPNYADASLFFFDTQHYASVFLKGSYHGREDDLITDFKKYKDKNFLIFSRAPFISTDYKDFFQRLSVHAFQIKHATFYYLVGIRFNYALYREKILKEISKVYWAVPLYWPHSPRFFFAKYFKD